MCSGLQFVYFDETRAQVALAAGDPQWAFDIAVRDLGRHPYVEEMLPIAARALAEQADAARDAGRDPAPALAEFRRRYPAVIPDRNGVVRHDEQRAWQAVG